MSVHIFEEIGAKISRGKNSKDFILLYQAKEKADVKDFHLKCDAKGPTVTILYGQYNTVFGGYTSKDWSSNDKRRVKDEDAFLFSKNDNINAKCVLLPIKKGKADWAITCDANFGPTFGGGLFADYDLQAFKNDSKLESDSKDNCMHLNGSLNVNCSYGEERETGDMGNNPGQDGSPINRQRKIKSKDINSGTLLVKTIEVYQVVDDKLEKDWFPKFEGEDFDDKRHELMEMSPLPGIDVKLYNILLVGVIGSGKSSFVNTLSALFSRKTVEIAPARDATTSVTCTVKAYILKSEHGDPLNIRIFDIRGFEDERGYDHELDLLLNGKLPVGYEFPAMPEPVPVQNQSKTTLNDEMHIVCFINGNPNFETNTKELHTRINDIKKTVAKKGIPMVIVATKFDQLCLKIAKNIDHIYKSPKAKHAAEKIADFYGVPLKHVFPVVNYVSEVETVEEKDRLALKALYEICQLVKTYLANHQDKTSQPDEWTERSELLQSMETTEQKAVYMRAMNDILAKFENEKLQVLVVGPTNSGKSSFIDSISSALKDDIVNTAVGLYGASAQINDASSTEKFQLHALKCKQDDGILLRSQVYFCDTPGFQENEGITHDHVKFIIKGNVPNKYKIINGIQETDRDFISDPLPSDRIHCVCFVFDCVSILKGLSENMQCKMKILLHVLQSEGIEYVVILTKCDVVSAAVKENKRRVFQERKVRECQDRLVEMFKFRQKIIFPVVNYTEENAVDLQSDALLMDAIKKVFKLRLDRMETDLGTEEGSYENGPEKKMSAHSFDDIGGRISGGEEHKTGDMGNIQDGSKENGQGKIIPKVINSGSLPAKKDVVYEKKESNKEKDVVDSGAGVIKSLGQEFSKPYDNSLTEVEVKKIRNCMTSVGALIFNDEIIGTVFRAGDDYVITAFHVIKRIIDPVQSGYFDYNLLEQNTVFVTFSASVCTTPVIKFRVRHRLSSNDPRLDYAVLQVSDKQLLPPKMNLDKYRFERLQEKLLSGIGYGNPNNNVSKTLDPNCPVILSVDQRIEYCQNWLRSQHCLHIVSEHIDKDRNIFLDIPMRHRGSGSPFLTSAGNVVGMLTHGHPEFYFQLPEFLQSPFPADTRFESLLRLDYVWENIHSRDPNLARELF